MSETLARLTTALSDRYRIERELGQGGMATVYLAHDLKHDRKVALKVLKPELAAVIGAERFVVEIKTTAALQHPHILPLFDSGTADSFLYYVMPFIDGETLRTKLDRETQLGIDESVRIASAVADALDYAHRHGVIHRDIKPENILLHDGRPMVADFGIALALSAAAGGRMTETGMSLGTPHYMSPEQATAEKDISARSDIYSLASVCYEMLTGNPPHTGASAQQIIMKIVTEDAAPVTKLRKSVPPNVAAAIAKALEKLPADRFSSAARFAEALGNPAFAVPGRESGPPLGAAGWRQRAAVPLLVVATGLLVGLVWAATRPAPSPGLTRHEVAIVVDGGVSEWGNLVVSPDGRQLAFVGTTDRGRSLFIRSMDQLGAVELPGTENAINPFFSPDGARLGFMLGGLAVKVVSFDGAPAVTVADSGVGSPGATWSPDGHIYFDALGIGPLLRVRERGGGRPEPASVLDSTRGELQHVYPDALPNGRGLLFVVNHSGPGRQGMETDEIAVLDTRTRQHRVLARGVYVRYAASGHILYVTFDGTLMAAPFDQDRLEMTGDPVAIAEGVQVLTGTGAVDLSISRTGTLWYTTGSSGAAHSEVVWVTRDGRVSEVDPGWLDDVSDPSVSPDGTRLAVTIRRPDGRHVWIKQLRPGGTLNKLTFDGSNGSPSWSRDGSSLAFVSVGSGGIGDIFVVAADGSSSPHLLFRDPSLIAAGALSPDGEWVVFDNYQQDILGRRVGGDSLSTPLVAGSTREYAGSVSPDGRWLLYVSSRTGRAEVFVSPFPGTSAALAQVSTNGGGGRPRWSRNGKEIYYQNGGDLVAVEVQPGPAFATGARRVLFRLDRNRGWDVTRDGRFVAIRDRSDGGSGRQIVVENFFEELKARVPR